MNIPLAKPSLNDDECVAVERVIKSGWVTQGPEVLKFEEEFKTYVGSKYACAVSSCTAGLHLAFRALGIGSKDKVITVSHSFIATANSIVYENAIPVFVDIDPNSLNIDSSKIEEVIDDDVKAILVVHQLGMPANLSHIKELSEKYDLFIIEDAACAVGSEIFYEQNWEKIGKPHGDIAVFSFHPRKIITTGDGGMITTNNSKIAKRLQLLRQHGMSVSDTTRHGSTSYIQEEYIELGFNYRMTDIQAAIGRVQLSKLDSLLKERKILAQNYIHELSQCDNVFIFQDLDYTRRNYQSFSIKVIDSTMQMKLIESLFEQNISAKRGVTCIHRERAYTKINWYCKKQGITCNCINNSCKNLQHSEDAQDTCIILPLYPSMSKNEQNTVINSLLNILIA